MKMSLDEKLKDLETLMRKEQNKLPESDRIEIILLTALAEISIRKGDGTSPELEANIDKAILKLNNHKQSNIKKP